MAPERLQRSTIWRAEVGSGEETPWETTKEILKFPLRLAALVALVITGAGYIGAQIAVPASYMWGGWLFVRNHDSLQEAQDRIGAQIAAGRSLVDPRNWDEYWEAFGPYAPIVATIGAALFFSITFVIISNFRNSRLIGGNSAC